MTRLGCYFFIGPAIARHPAREQSRGEDDDACYRDWLAAAAAEHCCAVHANVLMTNRVPAGDSGAPQSPAADHIVTRPPHQCEVSTNRIVWEGRYRAAPIDSKHIFSRAIALSRSIRRGPA
jgi:hypothetical protein